MATQAELEAQNTSLQQEASAIEAENARLATLKESIDAQNQLIATKKAEGEQAQQQLDVIRRAGGDTSRYEPFVKKAQEDYLKSVAETSPLIEQYNTSGQELNLRSEVLKSKAKEFNIQATEYNQKQQEFSGYLQSVAEGKNAVDVIDINTYQYSVGRDTYFGYESSRDVRGRYAGATLHVGMGGNEDWAIAGTRNKLGLGAEDVIRINGRTLQESSFTPEQIAIANQVFSGRMSALAAYEQERAREQEQLKYGMVFGYPSYDDRGNRVLGGGGTAQFHQPASYIEAYKSVIGNAPTAAQVNVMPYVQSEEQLKAKSDMLSNPALTFGTADFYAQQYAQMKARTEAPINPAGTERIAFNPDVEIKNGQMQFYGVEGSPGVQWSKSANEARIAEINTNVKASEIKNKIETWEMPKDINPATGKGYAEPLDLYGQQALKIEEGATTLKEAIQYGMIPYASNTRSEVFGTLSKNIAIGTLNLFGIASETAKAKINEKTSPGYVRSLATGLVDVGVSVPMVAASVIEAPTFITGWAVTGTLKENIKGAADLTPEVLLSPITAIKEAPTFAEGAGLATAYIGTALLGSKAFRTTIKNTGNAILNIKVTEPSYSLPGLLVKPVGARTIQVSRADVVSGGIRTVYSWEMRGRGILGRENVKVRENSVLTYSDELNVAPISRATPEIFKSKYYKEIELRREQANLKMKERAKAELASITAGVKVITGTKAELSLDNTAGVKAVPVIVAGQKGKAVLKTEAPTIQITRTGLKAETVQEARAITMSTAIQKSKTEQRQEAPQITRQKQKEKYIPVLIAKTGLNLKPVQDIGQIMKTPSSTRTKTTEIITPRTKIPRTPEETKQSPKKKPPPTKITSEKKSKELDLGIKTTEPKIEGLKKEGKGNPLYPASFENVNVEEFRLGGKRARQIRERKLTQELFEEQKKGGRSIPTLRQYKKRKGKGKG